MGACDASLGSCCLSDTSDDLLLMARPDRRLSSQPAVDMLVYLGATGHQPSACVHPHPGYHLKDLERGTER